MSGRGRARRAKGPAAVQEHGLEGQTWATEVVASEIETGQKKEGRGSHLDEALSEESEDED